MMANDNEAVREVCANCEVFDAYERFKAEKDAEIARLKAALKPVMKIKKQPALGLLYKAECAEAVLEAQRVMRKGGENVCNGNFCRY